jgi:hypothetical protein
VTADLPVGENLQDHITTMMDFSDNTSSMATFDKIKSPITTLQYLALGSGEPYLPFITLNIA